MWGEERKMGERGEGVEGQERERRRQRRRGMVNNHKTNTTHIKKQTLIKKEMWGEEREGEERG